MANLITKFKHCIVYTILFGLYVFTYIRDTYLVYEIMEKRPDIIMPKYGGRLKYLTFINMVYLNYIFYKGPCSITIQFWLFFFNT